MGKSQSLSLVLALLCAAACSSTDGREIFDDTQPAPTTSPSTLPDGGKPPSGPFTDPSASGIVIDPSNAILFIDTATTPATPAKQTFRVIKKGPAGDQDVTAKATFEIEKPELGRFTGASFESVISLPPNPPGVTSSITARVDGESGGGKITVVPLRRSTDQRDFFFIVPFGEAPTPTNDVLKFKTNIQSVDVAFVVDTTFSMNPEIGGIRTALAGTLLTQLQAAIPNVGMAIAHANDLDEGRDLVRVLQTITPTLSLAQAAANQLRVFNGGDIPEGQVPALFHVMTGQAVTGVPAYTPPAGTTGAVNFRSGSVPVVVMISDAAWHTNRGGATLAQVQTAFTSANARFVSLTSDGPANENEANTLSDATASNLPPSAFTGCTAGQCCTGVNNAARAPSAGRCRLNFKYQKTSPNISAGVVSAIKAIAVGSTYDVTVVPRNDPANPSAVDATKFIKALRAKDEGDPSQGCPAAAAKDTNGDGIKDTFTAVTVGTPVCFEVIPQTNTTVEPQATAQFYNAFLDVVGVPGNIKLDQRKVLFLVPPKGGSITK